MIALSDVLAARRRLRDRVLHTPTLRSDRSSLAAGAEVHLKLESLQPTGSFKIRGAFNALLRLREAGGGGPGPERVVTASAGNHGRAVAYAAARLGMQATIFTPRGAPRAKLDAIRLAGADLRADAPDYDEAERDALAHAAAGGGSFISGYSHPDIIAGAGSTALEVIEDVPGLDAFVVPLGGGGLIAGIAAAAKAIRPEIEVIGVEAAASQAFTTALAHGRITRVAVGPTIADGLAGNLDPDSITFEMVRRLVDRVVTVEEEELEAAIRALAAGDHLIAEGAGIAALAAVLSDRIDVRSRTVAAIVSGGNIDLDRLASILAAGVAGRP